MPGRVDVELHVPLRVLDRLHHLDGGLLVGDCIPDPHTEPVDQQVLPDEQLQTVEELHHHPVVATVVQTQDVNQAAVTSSHYLLADPALNVVPVLYKDLSSFITQIGGQTEAEELVTRIIFVRS